MKKRLFAGLIASAMMASMLAGCGGSSGSNGNAQGGDKASGDGYSMTLIMSLRDEFLSTLEAGSKSAADELGVTLASQDAQNDTGKMLQFIESAKNAGDDAVLINLVDAATAQQCIEAAGDMKVVFVNRAPSDTSVLEAGKSVAVVSNENTSGYYQGEFLANYFKDKGKTEIKYLMLQGTLGLVHTEQRSASVLKALEDNGIKATQAAAPLVADYDRANAMDMISPLLGNTEFDCIIANNDAMALGAVEALKAKGMDPTSIPIVGIDATVDGIQAIKDGTLAMTVFQDANGQGYGAVKAAVNLIEGKAINDGTDYETDETGNICWVPFEPVTPDNVADYEYAHRQEERDIEPMSLSKIKQDNGVKSSEPRIYPRNDRYCQGIPRCTRTERRTAQGAARYRSYADGRKRRRQVYLDEMSNRHSSAYIRQDCI